MSIAHPELLIQVLVIFVPSLPPAPARQLPGQVAVEEVH